MLALVGSVLLRRDRFEGWQLDNEPRPTVWWIFRAQAATVLLHDALREVEPQSQSNWSAIAMCLNKAIEDLLALVNRYANAVIAHGKDDHPRMTHAQTDLHARVPGAELERVVDQVGQHLFDAQRVHLRSDRAGSIRRDQAIGGARSCQVDDIGDQVTQIGRGPDNGQLLAGSKRSRIHEPIDHARESHGLPIDARERLFDLGRRDHFTMLVLAQQ